MKRYDRIILQGFKPGDTVISYDGKFVFQPRWDNDHKPWFFDMTDPWNYTRFPGDSTGRYGVKEVAPLDASNPLNLAVKLAK